MKLSGRKPEKEFYNINILLLQCILIQYTYSAIHHHHKKNSFNQFFFFALLYLNPILSELIINVTQKEVVIAVCVSTQFCLSKLHQPCLGIFSSFQLFH